MLYQIGIGFQGTHSPLHAAEITSRGLHGLLYHVLQTADTAGATWLHQHQSPKPYTIAPYYDTESHTLAGLRLNAMNEPAAELLHRSWEQAQARGEILQLGHQSLCINDLVTLPGPTYESLATLPPQNELSMQFLSPTLFKLGSAFLTLPIPTNVFRGPYRTWNAFAPPSLQIPSDWLDWCADHVFVTTHHIETVTVSLSRNAQPLIGFVGNVSFTARSPSLLYLSLWQALSHLAVYCGIGYKTTMGMGVVERMD